MTRMTTISHTWIADSELVGLLAMREAHRALEDRHPGIAARWLAGLDAQRRRALAAYDERVSYCTAAIAAALETA